ncbi:zinc finger protein ZFP2-like isoform X2 [Condylostylus longicornis]|uniref:zinc finger protein ZFP2-like isoform X2 n=1 Tax=Condylostylus longicornis TaxID=2530218 RepID=UPI00244E167B|nr:zinc finger protein ZFP2-like isoform X2 [Condylostylus longicornis]
MEICENLNESIKFAGTQVAPIKCFLCDKNFMVGDESYLLFAKRLAENEEDDVPMATVLSSAVGVDINESSAHSKVLCHNCNEIILEYELIEQRYIQLKFKLIKDYNDVVSKYEDTILYEVNDGNDDQVIINDDNETTETESSKIELTALDKNVIYEYLMDNGFVAVSSKDDIKENFIELQENCKSDLSKFENGLVNEIEENQNNDEHLNVMENKNSENEDNASLKSSDFTSFDLELHQKPKSVTTEDARPSFAFDGEKFFCLICGDNDSESETNLAESFDNKSIAVHLKEKHDVLLFVCNCCGGGFSKKADLLEHGKSGKCGEYECEVCFQKFDNLKNCRTHKKIHSYSLQCSICKKKFLSKKLLDEHLNVHSGIRPFKCYVCGKNFTAKYALNSHMKIHAERERPYSCNKCNKSFFTAANLVQHSKTHSSVKEFSCDICEKSFATQHNLEIHKIVHTGHKPFLCRTCGKSFARRTEITDHERTHTGERPFECDICGMKFAQRSNLSTHKKSTHFNEKKHKCDTCGKSFKRRRLLDYHIQAAHTGERPYKCDSCHSTFVYPEHYKKHLRIHSGVKPYSCEVCGKSFNSRDNRNAHRFIHSDKKPYECLTCGQGFMRKPLLYNHMQSVGHINDTIVVNQPRIKQTLETSINDLENGEIQIIKEDSDYKMVMDSRVILKDDSDEIDEIILEEEHLIDGMEDNQENSINQTLNENDDDNLIDEETLPDESYSINKYLKKII